jgi:ubiquinone/menaquinone biosynthesis C-methylase UbiE
MGDSLIQRGKADGGGQIVAPLARLAAGAYDRLLGPVERLWLADRRTALVAPAAGRVLEIGVGTGLTLPHYRAATEVVGIDPKPAMLERARARAAAAGVPVTLEVARAESLPFPAGRFDTAVASLVLCTVDDPLAAARELRRTLAPGGELRFLEHVRAPGRRLAWFQDLVTPVWRRIFGNCRPNRDTLGILRQAGFEVEKVSTRLGGVLVEGAARPAPGLTPDGPGGSARDGRQPR